MVENKIETKKDLDSFAKNNYEEEQNLIGKRESLWKQYYRAKTKERQTKMLSK